MLKIPYKRGDPIDFETYRGQDILKRRITLRLNAMDRGDSFKALFYAPAGQGKTSLARVVSNEMLKRHLSEEYFEITAGNLDSKVNLDSFMRQVPALSVVFIDEIHGLPTLVRDALYPAIQDNMYAFQGEPSLQRLPLGISWVGATTELGKVHLALQRRMMPMSLEPMSVDDRAILASSLTVPITPDACFEIAKRCLHYKTKVLLEDGTYKQIGEIVSKKLKVKVVSFNTKTNLFETKPIIDWISQDYDNTGWYYLSYEGSYKLSRQNSSRLETRGVWITGNHRILTANGYKQIKTLDVNKDKLLLNFPEPNALQLQVINGALLGDAFLRRGRINSKASCIKIIHSTKQKQWLNIKRNCLLGFDFYSTEGITTLGHAYCGVISATSLAWREMRNKWYPNGKKIVPRDIILTPITLATWYMDDGCLANNNSAILCTNGFEEKYVDILIKKLRDLGIKGNKNKDRNGIKIRIGEGSRWNSHKHWSATAFFTLIAKFIPEDMQYKLPNNFRGKFDANLWNIGEANKFCYRNINLINLDWEINSKSRKDSFKKMYCIEVMDNHNFVTQDMVLENCWSPWEVKDELFATSADVAVEKCSGTIEIEHVLEACGLLEIDSNGLRPKERLVLEALYKNGRKVKGVVRYSMAKTPLAVIAGIDELTFTNFVEPKLLRLGYIRVLTGVGRELTEKAIEEYFKDIK